LSLIMEHFPSFLFKAPRTRWAGPGWSVGYWLVALLAASH
jgi:hypothetical protein